MANEVIVVTDPMGNEIYFVTANCFTPDEVQEHEVYDDVTAVIKKPAILVEIKNERNKKELHYFRSIGWQNTLLIKVEFLNNRWETIQCIKNPSNAELSELLKKGVQII